MITLENKTLAVRISERGAELTSIKTMRDGTEFLWQGDKRFWDSQSPILFPIIGKLPDDSYLYAGKKYQLGSHGFARTSRFVPKSQLNGTADLELLWSEDTLRHYPFKFRLQVRYNLTGNSIETTYIVHNLDENRMLFSIGAHPGFNCPLYSDETMEDYYLEFEKKETVNRRFLNCGHLTMLTEPFLQDTDTVNLSPTLFERYAIILAGLNSKSLTLKSRKNEHHVRVDFPGFPYLGIWSAPGGAPFVCIEPWFGLSWRKDDRRLEDKEGILELAPQDTFNCSYKITID